MAQQGDETAMGVVLKRTEWLIASVVGQWANAPGDADQLRSLLNATLMDAVGHFDPAKGKFAPYLKKSLHRAVFADFARQSRVKMLHELIVAQKQNPPTMREPHEVAEAIDRASVQQRLEHYIVKLFHCLTSSEFRALQSVVRGESMAHTARRHRVSPQSVSKGMQQLRQRIIEVDAD